MTSKKCAEHELRKGEYADSARYTKAMRDAQTCWRCRAWAVLAVIQYKYHQWRYH